MVVERPRWIGIKPLFTRRSDLGWQTLLVLLTCVALMTIDLNTPWLRGPRTALETLVSPVFVAVRLPVAAALSVQEVLQRAEDNRALRRENLELAGRVLRADALRAENERLRGLLGSSVDLPGRVEVTELVGLAPDGPRETLLIDRGAEHGVFVGQAVLDAAGVVGQVVSVGAITARVLLITDATHAIPVQVLRNELRAVAAGTGPGGDLVLEHVPETADIREGDRLVTSGLGGRFPTGYPVADVVRVRTQPGRAFLAVQARPRAGLSQTRHFLLLYPQDPVARR